jgi:hypothetical protein
MSTAAIAIHPSLPNLPNGIFTLFFDHFFDAQRDADCHYLGHGLTKAYSTLYSLARACRSLTHVARSILQQKYVRVFRQSYRAFTNRTQLKPYQGTCPRYRHIKVLQDA